MDAGARSQDYTCDECGMVYADQDQDALTAGARAVAPRWRELVTGAEPTALRRRPDEQTWSALEYGWHMGSSLDWMADTLTAMDQQDTPTLDWYGHEEDVASADPNEHDLDEITTRIDHGSARLATVLASLDPQRWDREAEFPWGRRDVLDMARNAVHESQHHLWDVNRVLGAVDDG